MELLLHATYTPIFRLLLPNKIAFRQTRFSSSDDFRVNRYQVNVFSFGFLVFLVPSLFLLNLFLNKMYRLSCTSCMQQKAKKTTRKQPTGNHTLPTCGRGVLHFLSGRTRVLKPTTTGPFRSWQKNVRQLHD